MYGFDKTHNSNRINKECLQNGGFMTLKRFFILFLGLFSYLSAESGIIIHENTLNNGLKTVVIPNDNEGPVALYNRYNVGSKDEQTGEKGKAHFLEHTVFKGTDTLSESDIGEVTRKCAGSCNAFTMYDTTTYTFLFPKNCWQEALPLLADCMTNCTFKQELLNSEVQAVVQELKKRNDSYATILFENLMANIFADHPYHIPIIGYKQDLWAMDHDSLKAFYKKHYIPNNATLFVVGKVDPEEVFKQVEKHFGHIPGNPNYTKEKFSHQPDIKQQTTILYRNVNKPTVALTYEIPGLNHFNQHALELFDNILTKTRTSRLYSLLIENSLVTSLDVGIEGLEDHGLLIIEFMPTDKKNINHIIKIIKKEVARIAADGFTEQEFTRETNNLRIKFYMMQENNRELADFISKYYNDTYNAEYFAKLYTESYDQINTYIKEFASHYLRPTAMHKGIILPMSEQDKEYWQEIQTHSDHEDQKITESKVRTCPVEEPRYAHTVNVPPFELVNVPKPVEGHLANNIKVLSHAKKNSPLITFKMTFFADMDYEPAQHNGIYSILTSMLLEGTHKHTAEELAQLLREHSILISIEPDGVVIKALKEKINIGLDILYEILTQAKFTQKALDKIKQQAYAQYLYFEKNEAMIASVLASQAVYGTDHPYGRPSFATPESLENITLETLNDFYKKYITPYKATIAIVGDMDHQEIVAMLNKNLGAWQGPAIAALEYPALDSVQQETITCPLEKDQVTLLYAGLSVNRFDPDFDALLIFDSIFCQGMNSRLFQLREISGAFYIILGSLVNNVGWQPGMAYVKTVVSINRVNEVQTMLNNAIKTATDSLTQQEVDQAKETIMGSLNKLYASSSAITSTFLMLNDYNLPFDYFEHRKEQLQKVTLEDIKKAVKKHFDLEKMVVIKVGRV